VAVAAAQDGVASRAQLLAGGLSAADISRRTADGRLQLLHPGVYAIGHRALTRRGQRRAALLAGGERAVLSHRSAAAAHGLTDHDPDAIDVTIRAGRARTVPGIRAHRCKLDDVDVTLLHGLPIVTPMRALLDLAESAPQREVERALDAAVRLRLYDEQVMGDLLERAHGRHGLKRLRRAVAKLTPDAGQTWSEFERRTLELLRAHGLPRPEVNEPVLTHHVDLLWRGPRVIVELDSRAFHLTPTAFEVDRERDAELQAAGYVVQRFSYRQVTERPEWVIATLSTLLARRVAI
jgi:very-short-patch-repair endonuclease